MKLKLWPVSWLFIILSLSSCQSISEKIHGKIYNDVALIEKTLKPRKGFEGKLTWSRCVERKFRECKKMKMSVYDIEKREAREQLNILNFRCRIGTKRYKICKDKPGLCHFKNCKKRWFKERKCDHEYLGIFENYTFLIDAKLRCQTEG